MALIKCPECKREVSDKAEACIHCGYPIAKLRGCNNIIKESASSSSYKIRVIDIPNSDRESMSAVLVRAITGLKMPDASTLIRKNYSPIIMAGLSMEDAEVIKRIFGNEEINVAIEPDKNSTQRTTLNVNAKGKIGVEAINYFIPKQDENDFLFCPRCRSKLVDTVSVTTFFSWGEPMNVCQKCGYEWKPGKR